MSRKFNIDDKYKVDAAVATEFFHQVELDQGATHAANSDLDLLLEAEKRCLLDPVTYELLGRAKSMGLVPKTDVVFKTWPVQNLGYTGLIFDLGTEVVTAIDTINKLKTDGHHSSQVTASMSPVGFKIGDDVVLRTMDVHKVVAFGKEVAVFSQVRDKTRRSSFAPKTQSSLFCNCHVFKCPTVLEATEIIGDIDRFVNFKIFRDNNPIVTKMTIQRGVEGQGIGVQLGLLPGGVFITDVEEHSIASYAQLTTGMQVVKVNNTEVVSTMSVEHVEALMMQGHGDNFTLSVKLDQHFGRNSLTRPTVRFAGKAASDREPRRTFSLSNDILPDDIA